MGSCFLFYRFIIEAKNTFTFSQFLNSLFLSFNILIEKRIDRIHVHFRDSIKDTIKMSFNYIICNNTFTCSNNRFIIALFLLREQFKRLYNPFCSLYRNKPLCNIYIRKHPNRTIDLILLHNGLSSYSVLLVPPLAIRYNSNKVAPHQIFT